MGNSSVQEETMSMDWRRDLRDRKIRPRKTRGQNFLMDGALACRIVDLLRPRASDAVLEIGPGLGSLTEQLLGRVGSVLGVEIERSFCEELSARHGAGQGLELVQGDILKTDTALLWERLNLRKKEGGGIKVLSNLPYYVGTAVMSRFVTGALPYEAMVLTMQKEVAERVTSPPGSRRYGSLSVLTQFFCHATIEMVLPPGAFFPSPKVHSAVVRFVPREDPPVLLLDRALFFETVYAAFGTRRKTLRNSLARHLRKAGLDKGRGEGLLAQAGIDPKRRAETLSIGEFGRLSNLMAQWRR